MYKISQQNIKLAIATEQYTQCKSYIKRSVDNMLWDCIVANDLMDKMMGIVEELNLLQQLLDGGYPLEETVKQKEADVQELLHKFNIHMECIVPRMRSLYIIDDDPYFKVLPIKHK